jgi:hypothetical protein
VDPRTHHLQPCQKDNEDHYSQKDLKEARETFKGKVKGWCQILDPEGDNLK